MTERKIIDEEQPDGIADDSRDLPDPTRAAERVNGFLSWFGDGRVYLDDPHPPLFARDLQALSNCVTPSAATQTAEQARQAVVDDFIDERADYVTALNNSTESNADYFRWQGHAEARRQLCERFTEVRRRAAGSPVTETTTQEVGPLSPAFDELDRLIAEYKAEYDREPPARVTAQMMVALLRDRGWERRSVVLLPADDCDCTPPYEDCMHGPEPVDALAFMRWLHAEVTFELEAARNQLETLGEMVIRILAALAGDTTETEKRQ